jgi:aryl-alcohol dehydrogenase-like predicted oxidoreductase
VYHNEENFRRLERARIIAEKHGISVPAVALAWTLNQPINVWALVGYDSVEQLRENLGTVNVSLSKDELAFLEHGDTVSSHR